MDPKPVRTYLDPDAVGPLPRALVADDSDALAAARTVVRFPDSPTEEIRFDDVIEIFDPSHRPWSLAPVGAGAAAFFAPRRHLIGYVVGALAIAGVLIVVALTKSLAPLTPQATPASAQGPAVLGAVIGPAPVPAPRQAAEGTVGTLRVDGSVEGQRVYVDGVALTAPVALLRCGPHELAVGSPSRARTVDVPCGGDVTVFR